MKQLKYLIVCLSLALYSCSSNTPEQLTKEEFKVVKVSGKYSLEVPKYMKRTTGINKHASLQYQDLSKGTYVIVIDEDTTAKQMLSKAMALSGGSLLEYYRKQKMNQLSKDLQINQQHNSQLVTISGLEAEMLSFDAKVKNVNTEITYFLTFVEGKKSLYMLMGGTMASQRKKYQYTFEQIAKSFKEL